MAIITFLGPEISEEEKAGYSTSADCLEKLRKDGVSWADIGAQRAKVTMENIKDVGVETKEKPLDV